MKVSIIIAILNSHKVVVRQLRHFKYMGLPNDVEILFVDDGSNPPLNYSGGIKNFRWLYTNDKRPWTQGLARNMGASMASGEYLFFTDIDHIIPPEAIDAVRHFKGDLMNFPRQYGILSRYGELVNDKASMLAFGALFRRVTRHVNTFAMRRTIFEEIGGYDRKHCERMFHVGGRVTSEEGALFSKYRRMAVWAGWQPAVSGPMTYFYPTGRFRVDGNTNPRGLFHGLSIEPVPQPMLE